MSELTLIKETFNFGLSWAKCLTKQLLTCVFKIKKHIQKIQEGSAEHIKFIVLVSSNHRGL